MSEKKAISKNFSAATAKRRDCALKGRITGTHFNQHGIYEMLVNGIIVAVHGVCLNVNVFRWFAVSVRYFSFLSDVGKIADSDAQYSQSNHFENCRLFGVFIFLPPATFRVYCAQSQTYTRNFWLCILRTNQMQESVRFQSKGKSKWMRHNLRRSYIWYLFIHKWVYIP